MNKTPTITQCVSRTTPPSRWPQRITSLGLLMCLVLALPAQGSISVGFSGSGVNSFTATPAATEWATLSWTGAPADVTTAAGLDTAVAALTASSISTVVGTSSTLPPSVSNLARRNTAGNYLQMRPDGTKKGVLLIAKLQNTAGLGINHLLISYDFAVPAAGTEEVPGLRAYYSLTGLANSWTAIPALCTATAGNLSANVALSSTWANGTALYVLWADDDAAGTDAAYTIDNISFTPNDLRVVVTPTDGQTISYTTPITAVATVGEASPTTGPYTVKIFTNTSGSYVQAGSDLTTSPYQVNLGTLANGTYHIYATVTDSGSTTATSPINTFTVANLPPTVSITSPANNTVLAVGSSVTINATAADVESSITRVDFYGDGTLLGNSTTSPYSYTWVGASDNVHVLTAVAWDATGLSTTSAAVAIRLGAKIDVSNVLNPWEPANTPAGVRIDPIISTSAPPATVVRLVGLTQTHWGSGGFTKDVDLNGNTFIIDSGNGNTMNASGTITNSGAVIIDGGGSAPIRIQGSTANNYTGTTLIRDGTVTLQKPAGLNALCGTITVGTTSLACSMAWTNSNQLPDTSDVTVMHASSFLNLMGKSERINNLVLTNGAYVDTGGGVLNVKTLLVEGVSKPKGAYTASSFVTGSGYIDVDDFGPPVIATIPDGPATPTPTNGTVLYPPAFNDTLDWTDCAGAISYDVYYWLAGDTKPATPTANVAVSSYTVGTGVAVLSLTNYKWQVVAKNAVGTTNGPEWGFSTLDRTKVPGNAGQPASDGNANLNYMVGIGNSGTLLGDFTPHWSGASGSFSVPLNLNGFILDGNTGGGNGGHNVSGPISGTGSYIITHGPHNNGTWNLVYTISGSTPNTYSGGTTIIKRGQILLNKTAGVDALPAGGTNGITLGSAGTTARLQWGASDQINNNASITVLLPTVSDGFTADANMNYLDLAGYSDTISSLTLPDNGTKTQVRTGLGGVLTVTNLSVNGAPVAIGTYTSNNWAFVQGSGSVVVLGVATTTVLTSTPNPSTLGAPVTLTATITGQNASGTVSFMDGLNTLGTAPVSGGTATLTNSALTFGSHSLTAVYGGDSFNQGSTSSPLSQSVNNHPPVTSDLVIGALTGEPATLPIIGSKHGPTDEDGDPLTVTAVGTAANGTATTDGTSVTYTSANTFTGTNTFTYTVSDSRGGLATGTVTVVVAANGEGFTLVSANLSGMKYAAIPGFSYALEHTPSLTPPVVWTPIATNTASTNNGVLTFTNTANGFYRTRWVP